MLTACDLNTIDPAIDNVDPIPVDPTGQVFPETGYTKISNDGIILADQSQVWDYNGSEPAGTQWSCVRDNDTGLYWEVKTNDGGLRDVVLYIDNSLKGRMPDDHSQKKMSRFSRYCFL